MSREDLIEVQGKVLDNLPQGKFKVELENAHEQHTYLTR